MKEKIEHIEQILKQMPWQCERGARQIEAILAEMKKELKE